jgi:leucyl aminopeptidase
MFDFSLRSAKAPFRFFVRETALGMGGSPSRIPRWIVATDQSGARNVCVRAAAGRPALRGTRISLGDESVWALAAPDAARDGSLPWKAGRQCGHGRRAWLGARLIRVHPVQAQGPRCTLVWPAQSDQSQVERIAQGVFLARDMINTPAEDTGRSSLPTRCVRGKATGDHPRHCG